MIPALIAGGLIGSAKAKDKRMRIEPNIAQVPALFGEASRAALLMVLLGGRALSAGKSARIDGAGVTAASGHLAKLVGSKLALTGESGRSTARLLDARPSEYRD